MQILESFDPSNAAQLDNWDGDTGAFWTENADRFDRGVAAYQGRFLEAAEIEDTSAVLDIGCGTGQATRDAARRASAGSALGVDLSSRMLVLARRRAATEQLANVTFEQADAQIHPFPPHTFDRAISRHGSMFFGDPVAAFANLARALRPGGRLTLLTWQSFERNEFMNAVSRAVAVGREVTGPPTDAPSPLALSDPDRVRSLLTAAGFTNVRLESVSEPMYLGADAEDAFEYLTGQHASTLRGQDPDTRERALDNLRASIADHHTEHGVRYDSATWLVHAHRR